MHQGRCISSALLLFFATIMAGFVAHPVVAQLHLVNSKDEALKYCKEKEGPSNPETTLGSYYNIYAVYPDQQGNDVFYNCGYERVEKTDVNRSKKDCKVASKTYKDTPVRDYRYKCYSDGRWVLMFCDPADDCQPLDPEDTEKPNPVREMLENLLLKLKGEI
ncbi:hypothetical protein O0I10_011816 [Lichtheimia ornata]|uniref:Uncharacterized protein n=1 Tax=Lichtheimia ornata TaxID=688661 RepID=A0AAD7USC5_9FUNG|nr:uncharacterized protein O0I10_011816 [Lichtheimia ornata]KAJ8652557.1 hypothetical protein O0I10_011816 [Lichtheimia ornata]